MSSLWPVLHYDDTNRALRFLVQVLGFREVLVVRDDEGDVVHAELGWPGGGSLVFGPTKHVDSVHGAMKAGTSACYLVTDDVDAVHERVARGEQGAVVQAPNATRFGSNADVYACTVRDPEGSLWTFGTYRGAP